ncbi:MAG: N-acetylmuramoyl-L-alanine amidase [Kiritimatiellae bacterium]|nr:N-acetylmuramoyl-L-alanine amidase [Kiritimatiellia bacterium]
MRFARAVVAAAVCIVTMQAAAIDFSNRYRSPRNPERKLRKSTELIVLHTTEAPARSSLNKLKDRGEAHYCVTEEGTVYRIVDRDRVAFHAGRSMWNGKEDVDDFSIGIECVGYHDQAMGLIQLRAIRDLVALLQKMYNIPDERVVCHSHVAYGVPNRWQKKRHRGRKRCGMLFAMQSVRDQLGLKKRPATDADVRAKRLVVGDPYLRKILYGNVDTMKGKYPATAAAEKKESSGGLFSWLRGKSAAVTPKEPKAIIKAKAVPKSIADLKSLGYVMKGQVTKGKTASEIAGAKWNASDTYYTIRDKVIPGTKIDPSHIEKGMCVWMKK